MAIASIIGLVVLDQVVKHFCRVAVDGVAGRSISALWAGVLELKLVYNEGVAFGMFQGAGVFLTPIAVAIAGFALYYLYRHGNESKWSWYSMVFLAAGSLGNLYDRLVFGKVTDMFWVRIIDFPLFNVADILITAAGTMIVLSAIQDAFTAKKKKDLPEPPHEGESVGAGTDPQP